MMLGWAGCGGIAAAPAAVPHAATNTTAACPAWEQVALDELSVGAPTTATQAETTRLLRKSLNEGRLLEAAALANRTAARCAEEPHGLEAEQAKALGQVLASLRTALYAPKSGDDYVNEARAASAGGRTEAASAAWDRAYLAYRRETHVAPQPTTLSPVSRGWVRSRHPCRRGLRTAFAGEVTHDIWRLSRTERYLWHLKRGDDASPLFEGVVEDLEVLGSNAWLVRRSDSDVELWTSAGVQAQVPISTCLSAVDVVGSWLIWVGNDKALQFLELADPQDAFSWPIAGGGEISLSVAGSYVLVRTRIDEESAPLAVFRLDMPPGQRQVWTRTQQDAGNLFLLPKWGAVLALRGVRPQAKNDLGFEWELQAIQLDTGKRLARILMAPDYEVHPTLALSARYGLVAVGRGGEVRVAPLGGGTDRKVPSKEVVGQVEDLAVTDDGLVCSSAVVHGRYYSCALEVIADLRGGGRQRGNRNLVCLREGDHVWSATVSPGRGRERVVSGGRTVFYGVCGERLAPDGKSAAFLEVSPRRTDQAPYEGAVVNLFDTHKRVRLHELPLRGRVEPMNPFIDLAYSPDGRHLAVLYDRHAEVFTVPEGVPVGTALEAPDWLGLAWVDERTLSGGAEHERVYTLEGERFVADPSGAGGQSSATSPPALRCLVGDRLVPAEVCSSVSSVPTR